MSLIITGLKQTDFEEVALKEDKICMQIIIILSRARYGIEKTGWLVRFEFQGQLRV